MPTSSPVTQLRPSPEQEPGRVGKGQPSRGRAGNRQPCASTEHVPGNAASPHGSWQAVENKLLLVPSGCFFRLGCQLLHARAALAGPGLCGGEGSRQCLLPQPLALPRGIPSQLQPLCQGQEQGDPACSSRTGHRLGTGSCLAPLVRKRHHLPASHGRGFPSCFLFLLLFNFSSSPLLPLLSKIKGVFVAPGTFHRHCRLKGVGGGGTDGIRGEGEGGEREGGEEGAGEGEGGEGKGGGGGGFEAGGSTRPPRRVPAGPGQAARGGTPGRGRRPCCAAGASPGRAPRGGPTPPGLPSLAPGPRQRTARERSGLRGHRRLRGSAAAGAAEGPGLPGRPRASRPRASRPRSSGSAGLLLPSAAGRRAPAPSTAAAAAPRRSQPAPAPRSRVRQPGPGTGAWGGTVRRLSGGGAGRCPLPAGRGSRGNARAGARGRGRPGSPGRTPAPRSQPLWAPRSPPRAMLASTATSRGRGLRVLARTPRLCPRHAEEKRPTRRGSPPPPRAASRGLRSGGGGCTPMSPRRCDLLRPQASPPPRTVPEQGPPRLPSRSLIWWQPPSPRGRWPGKGMFRG